MRRCPAERSGYALMLVLMFIVLLLAFLMVAYRSVASAVRIESVRSAEVSRDEGTVAALAKGLALLETGLPPSAPYAAAVTIDTPTGPRQFAVTFTCEGGTAWSVRAADLPSDAILPVLPPTFAVLP
jgi:hypothetical protein